MTLPKKVQDADESMVVAGGAVVYQYYPVIRVHLLSQDAEISRLQSQLDAGTEAGWHALRNERDALQADLRDADERCALRSRERTEAVMRAEKAESRLAAADALLREALRYIDPRHYPYTIKRIGAYLSEPHHELS